jgi:hypothetical protein
MTMRAELTETMRAVLERHPRPWHIKDYNLYNQDTLYAEICDAEGEEVIGASEWLYVDYDVMQLVVGLVNEAHLDPVSQKAVTGRIDGHPIHNQEARHRKVTG